MEMSSASSVATVSLAKDYKRSPKPALPVTLTPQYGKRVINRNTEMKTICQRLMNSTLMIVGVLAAPMAICQDNADFMDRIVFNDNQSLQVVPYTIAQLLVETCYDNPQPTAIRCPSHEEFSSATVQWSSNEDYQAAIHEHAQRRTLRTQLAHLNGIVGSQKALRVGITPNKISMRQLTHLSSETYDNHVKHLEAPAEVFARIIQGMFELNLEKTSGSEFFMTEDIVTLLYQFTDQSGKPLFLHSLERIAAAKRLSSLGISYKFLKQEEQWVVDGVTLEWLKKNASMETVYLSLIENLSNDDSRPVI
jgi:hypothetical protein